MTPEQVIDDALFVVRKFRMDLWKSISGLCESPIEELFAAAVFASGIDNSLGVNFYAKSYSDDAQVFEGDHCWPQSKIGNYRVDFLFCHVSSNGDRRFVAVECDGHDFHEKTKAQAAHDKARDRFLVSRGIRVMRFTGSEIFADPMTCWTEVLNVLWEARAAA